MRWESLACSASMLPAPVTPPRSRAPDAITTPLLLPYVVGLRFRFPSRFPLRQGTRGSGLAFCYADTGTSHSWNMEFIDQIQSSPKVGETPKYYYAESAKT